MHDFCAPENGPLAQGLLEVILDRAYLKRSPANDGGIVTIHLEGWQIDVLTMFGVVIKNEWTDPNSMETTKSGRDQEFRPKPRSLADTPESHTPESQSEETSGESTVADSRLVTDSESW